MKHFLIASAILGIASIAQATTINAPGGLIGKSAFNANYAYLWTAPVAAQDITSATITFTGVVKRGGRGDSINVDFGSFLNLAIGKASAPSAGGFGKIKDSDLVNDAFKANVTAGKAVNLGTQHFPSLKTPQTWSYTFTADQLAALNSYISAGNWGFEIDPDGKFAVGGITFNYTSAIGGAKPAQTVAAVPDSISTVGLLGGILLCLFFIRRNAFIV